MIASEDRHIPKTRVTHRYNSFTKRWEKEKAPSGATTYDQHSTVSQSRMPRSIGQAPGEGKTVFRIPGGEFKDEDRGISGNPAVQTEDTLTPQRQRRMQQLLTQDERQANADVRPTKDPMEYGMPSENPPAKIPNPRGLSGSSGVYRTQTGPITLDDMERILGSVYSEVQKCGCHHICTDPCSCSTAAQKDRIGKSGADSPVTKEESQRAQKFSRDLKESRRQWEAEHQGELVDKEFGLQSLNIPEFAQSISSDCHCPNRTDKTIQCRCLIR